MNNEGIFSAKKITYFSILAALVVVLQVFGGSLKIGAVSLNFTLVPVVLCGMLLGVFYGTLIGFIVGAVTFIMVITGTDGWTLILFNQKPLVIILVCFVKSTSAGFLSAFMYKILGKKNRTVGSIVSSITAPIVNTGIFVLGMLIILNTLESSFDMGGKSVYYYLFILVIGINFIAEFALNVILAPTINKIVTLVNKRGD